MKYPIIYNTHKLHNSDKNKTQLSHDLYDATDIMWWHNHPPGTPNHGKYGNNGYGCYFRFDDDNKIRNKSMIKYYSKIGRALVRF